MRGIEWLSTREYGMRTNAIQSIGYKQVRSLLQSFLIFPSAIDSRQMASLSTCHYEPPMSLNLDNVNATVSISVLSGKVAWASSNGMLHMSTKFKI